MSIEDDLLEPETITEGDRALALFTDRYEFTRLFVERLNDDPAPNNILFLYGEGGNGKSLLLKHLRQKACRRLIAKDEWEIIKAKPDAELADNITRLKPQVCRVVPTAFLDFGSKPLGDAQPQDRFYGLLTLRKDLGEAAKGNYSLAFRRFDFACVWYLHQKGRSPDEIKSFFPADQGLGLATAALDALTQNPAGSLGKGVLDMLNPSWSQRLMVWKSKFGISKDEIEAITTKDLDTELIEALPKYLADDLNDTMAKDNAPPRIVLFFDTHEAFWGENRSEARANYFFSDEWLRLLLRKLDYEAGIVAVVAGREPPRWAEAKTVKSNTDIPAQYLDLHRVGNLSAADALAYLQQPAVGIADAALCQSLIAYASVEPGEVHPLHLGLCADVVLQAQTQGNLLTAEAFGIVPDFADKSKLLIERLLRYVSDAVRDAVYALSACRAFDFTLYNQLGETLKFAANRPDYDLITRFSFVKQLPEPQQDWHRLHGLLRRLNAEYGNERVIEANHFLEQHYRAQQDQAEAIYHANQLNPNQGAAEWIETFDQALGRSQYDACESLLEIRRELRLPSHFHRGGMSQLAGDFYQNLARHKEAEQEYLESIRTYHKSLQQEGDTLESRNNQGNVYSKLGNLQFKLSKHQDALVSYLQAIDTYDRILFHTPSHTYALNNKGNVFQSLGELQVRLSKYADALTSYCQAITVYDEALQYTPDHVSALNNKGHTLQKSGKLQASLSQHINALASYKQAIAVFDNALRFAPDFVPALNNKGNTLVGLGELQIKLFEHPDALASYQKAIVTYGEVLHWAPDNIAALNNKGNTLLSLGNLQAQLSRHSDALICYQQAIATFDDALYRAPDTIEALNNKGNVLRSRGELQARIFQHTDALGSYQQAIAAYDEALRHAPDFVQALNNKGNVWAGQGDLHSKIFQPTSALASYQQAITAYDEALRHAPNYATALNNKGVALQSLGKLQTGLFQPLEAQVSYQQAITTHDKALYLIPEDIFAFNNKGLALVSLAQLKRTLKQEAEAIQNLRLALACFSRSLELTPKNSFIQNLHDQIQASLAGDNSG